MKYPKPLEIATRAYYWKPASALFRSLEMRSYSEAHVYFDGPTLDLGCGDGRVAQVLRELGITERPLCGLDISRPQLRRANKRKSHLNLLQADAHHLPFKDERFASIICNGVLCSIRGGPEKALAEANRILKKKGVLVATVPTDKYNEVLIWPQVLGRLSTRLRSFYIRRLNERLGLFESYSHKHWEELFERNGFRIIKSGLFFSHRAGLVWNVLVMQIFRAWGILKFIDGKVVERVTNKLLKTMFAKIYESDQLEESRNFGYVLVVAEKAFAADS
jgi:ubiquinone/menaquinone biosynthesis C-methylase UbiE